jgi:electron transfer flavoprotein alpha subunit
LTTTEAKIVVIAETVDGRPAPVTYELTAWAGRMEEIVGGETMVLLLGDHPSEAGGEIAEKSGLRVIAAEVPSLEYYNREVFVNVLSWLLTDMNVGWSLAGHTAAGSDFASGLAVRLQAASISGVDGLADEDGEPVFQREVFGGKVRLDMTASGPPVVVTFLPGSIRPVEAAGAGNVEILYFDDAPDLTRTLGVKGTEAVDSALDRADVVVAAGRGIGKREKLELVRRLAACFPSSAVAGSRPICDLGWLGYQNQVGQTGRTITPKLYVACGISGARQHTIGMKNSGFIVSVNTDPAAPICNLADVCVVEDLNAFIPAFEDLCKKM